MGDLLLTRAGVTLFDCFGLNLRSSAHWIDGKESLPKKIIVNINKVKMNQGSNYAE